MAEEQTPQQGQETFLSVEERAQLRRIMGHPEDYPKEMMAHIRDWLSVNPPDIPIGQITGLTGVPRILDRSAASVTVVNTDVQTSVYSYTLKAKTISPTGLSKESSTVNPDRLSSPAT